MTEVIQLQELARRLETVLPPEHAPYPLHEPSFSERDRELVLNCLEEGWVSSVGEYVGKFESTLANYTGAGHVVAVVNGTAALHLALRLAGVGVGDEVLMPTVTFIATANAVTYCGAIPHFVDSEPYSLGVDAERLRQHLSATLKPSVNGPINKHTGRRVAALVAVHVFGHPADADALAAVCADFGIEFVEDAAESLGSFYKSLHSGLTGRLAALSFNGNKIITTGGGGAVVTNDVELAARAKHLSTTAKQPHPWAYEHDEVGFNYRLPNLNAALGCAQMERLPEFVSTKRILAQRYKGALAGLDMATFLVEPVYARSNYWLNAIVLERDEAVWRDKVLWFLHDKGIKARPLWGLMHHQPMFVHCPRMDLSCAESLERRMINLPSSAHLAAPDRGN